MVMINLRYIPSPLRVVGYWKEAKWQSCLMHYADNSKVINYDLKPVLRAGLDGGASVATAPGPIRCPPIS